MAWLITTGVIFVWIKWVSLLLQSLPLVEAEQFSGSEIHGKTPYFVLWPGYVFQQIWGIFVQEFRSSKTEGFTGGFRSEGRTAAVKKQDEEGAGQSWIPGNVEAIALEIILFCSAIRTVYKSVTFYNQ